MMNGPNRYHPAAPLIVPDDLVPPTGEGLRRAYADRGLAQIPRLLSLEDRNEFSRSYGSFNREYWLCRTVDFPSSIAQFGVHALALAYTQPFPDNPYNRNPKILLWSLAAIEYWIRDPAAGRLVRRVLPERARLGGPDGISRLRDVRHLPAPGRARPAPSWTRRFRVCVARAAPLPGEVR